MATQVVRYPKAMALPAVIFLGVAAVGFRMAVEGRGHWTFWHVGIFFSLGIWFLLYVLLYRTVFSADSVEQRVFPRAARTLRYVDIERIKLEQSGRGLVLVLRSSDGRQMKVYGDRNQLAEVQDELFDRFPNAFGGAKG